MSKKINNAVYDHLWQNLLSWYNTYKRDLPWRQTRDPYAILVAETMLQQTGVERVIPKYIAFLERWPTLQALAQAPTVEVIRLWSGLGYNRRAVWLQQAARQALAKWGALPSRLEDLSSLPGVGPYTARAMACFAFDAQVAVTETNVRRVLVRLILGLPWATAGTKVEQRYEHKASVAQANIQEIADSILPLGHAYEWNQALMDLGATVCTLRGPRCLICPLCSFCKAYPTIYTSTIEACYIVGETKPHWKEEPFVGSRRYYRGRVINILCQLQAGDSISISDLGLHIKPDFTQEDLPWLRTLVADLVKDGLVVFANDRVSLPG